MRCDSAKWGYILLLFLRGPERGPSQGLVGKGEEALKVAKKLKDKRLTIWTDESGLDAKSVSGAASMGGRPIPRRCAILRDEETTRHPTPIAAGRTGKYKVFDAELFALLQLLKIFSDRGETGWRYTISPGPRQHSSGSSRTSKDLASDTRRRASRWRRPRCDEATAPQPGHPRSGRGRGKKIVELWAKTAAEDAIYSVDKPLLSQARLDRTASFCRDMRRPDPIIPLREDPQDRGDRVLLVRQWGATVPVPSGSQVW